nr:hypothetical protein [Tanacetum cinerariifolium]
PWPILESSFAESIKALYSCFLLGSLPRVSPRGLESLSSWERGKTTWGGRVEAMGTIPVYVCAQESWGEGTGVLAGKLDKMSLEEQTDGEAMINSIQNGDQPLPIIAQVS